MEKQRICILAHPADAEDAERLYNSICKYRMPKLLHPRETALKYHEVLLDVTGEPLSEDAAVRLNRCRQLIVLCSPAVRDFAPIREKLLHFEAEKGRQSIIAVILRGEPIEAFPPFFIEKKMVARIQPDGSIIERMETQEPIASDLRASSRREARAMLRYETVRIVASLLGLEPDALERRHAKRVKRRAILTVALVCPVCLAIAVIFGSFYFLAKQEGDTAAAMTQESMRVIDRLVNELPAKFQGNAAAEALVTEAIKEAQDILESGSAADLPASP